MSSSCFSNLELQCNFLYFCYVDFTRCSEKYQQFRVCSEHKADGWLSKSEEAPLLRDAPRDLHWAALEHVVATWVRTGAKRLWVSSCPSSLQVPPRMLRGLVVARASQVQQLWPEPSRLPNMRKTLRIHLHWAAGLQNAAAPAETGFGRKGQNCRLWGGWRRRLGNRGRDQCRKSAGHLFILFFQMEDICSVLSPAT